MERLENPTLPKTGCYVDGHWGWRGTAHMIEQFDGWFYTLDADDERLLAEYERGEGDGLELVADMADVAAQLINVALPDNLLAHWHDGEFFVSPYCGGEWGNEECENEECACHSD